MQTIMNARTVMPQLIHVWKKDTCTDLLWQVMPFKQDRLSLTTGPTVQKVKADIKMTAG